MKTQWGLGKPFECGGCEAQLVIPKNFGIGLGALLIFWLLKDRTNSPIETAVLIVGLVALVLALSRIFLIPKKV
ncbi:MAG: hypothetical protein VYE13_01240 [Pseudomonadota bacterium]|jgi:hypothetical protein|nr:hypothetical protein A3726_14025 [Erythrobacter sp. HI0037]KZY15557.1 hypothetical protein A3727_08420 [Erythrobacter sp. HI0038]MEC7741083.1 hypothetical protein [Pseudomonadota bacterium]MEE3154656.1 hypothetical protein [Pseudomonadota bacterium]